MSSHRRPSPRASIRDWLLRTEAVSTSHEYSHRNPQSREDVRKSPCQNQKDNYSTHCGSGESSHGDSNVARRDTAKYESPKIPGKENVSLPQRLGLHAPFRSFGPEFDCMDIDTNMAPIKQKWKRRRSSSSSYLEPAAFAIRAGDKKETRYGSRDNRSRGISRELDDSTSQSSSTIADTSINIPLSLDELKKPYQKRSRHKTREDRYDLKQAKKAKKQKKGTKKEFTRKSKKRKHNEKSGVGLMHDFVAQNVASNRLTLRSASMVGLFSKGRASSPVKRRGLPDLAFSEMTFLNSRREKSDKPGKPIAKKSRRKKDKALDTGAEISRYFTTKQALRNSGFSARLEPVVPVENPRYLNEREDRGRNPEPEYRVLPFLDLPDKPFLGFGSSGIENTSPVRVPKNINSSIFPPGSNPAPSLRTSQISWSVSEVPQHRPSPSHRADRSTSRSARPSKQVSLVPNEISVVRSDRNCNYGDYEHISSIDNTNQERSPFRPQTLDLFLRKDPPKKPSRMKMPDTVPLEERDIGFANPVNSQTATSKDTKTYKSCAESNAAKMFAVEVISPKPDLPQANSQNEFTHQTLSDSFDAALEKFLRKCRSRTPRLANQPLSPTKIPYVLQSEKPNIVICDGPVEQGQFANSFPVGNEELTHPKSAFVASCHSSLLPGSKLSTQPLGLQADDLKAGCLLPSPSQRCRKALRVASLRSGSSQTNLLAVHEISSKVGESISRNVWDDDENVCWRQTQPESHISKTSQGKEHIQRYGNVGNDKNPTSFGDSAPCTSCVPIVDEYEAIYASDPNGKIVTLEDDFDKNPEVTDEIAYQETEEMQERNAYYFRENGTGLDFLPCDGSGDLDNGAVNDEDSMYLPEDSPVYGTRHIEISVGARSPSNRRFRKSWCQNQWDARYMAGNRGRAQLDQQYDEVLPGFWKPHIRS